jgi:hypothetical protein
LLLGPPRGFADEEPVKTAQTRFDPPPDPRKPGMSGSDLMHQMAAQGFRNIF